MQSKRPLTRVSSERLNRKLHFVRRLPASMQRLTLLFLFLGLVHAVCAAAFEFPDLTRRLPERTSTPGCAYKGQRYAHGDQVETPEPCLNCTCIRAVVVCYLRVCPSASAPPPGCFLAREVGQCCPSLVCSADKKPKPNETSAESDLRPTFQPETSKKEEETTTTITTTTTNNIEENSLMFVTSTQPDDEIPLLNDIPGGCLVNGTLYGDGSAMLSSSFCEYCFCIRGKTTCLKPKCDLVIEGCTPHFDSHFSCCPSRYDCFQKTTILDSDETTVTVSTTTVGVTQYSDNQSTCFLAGVEYHQGQVIPDYRSCHNCYCSSGSIICDKIKCSPALAGCQPIIPDGDCCPVSYKCDNQGKPGISSIKVIKLNNSHSNIELKKTDIKTVRQSDYFQNNHSPNTDAGAKNHINDLTEFFHNFFPAHRRLDEDVEELYNSPVENFNSSGNSSENSTTSEITTDQITTHLRENDKTIDLEIAKSGEETTPIYPQTGDDLNNGTSFVTKSVSNVSVGPPEVQTISIQELFQQFFANKNINISNSTTDVSNEPKRNNSKQPSSIIDLEHHITTHSHSYNSNETKSTVNTYAPSTTTENLYKSTTETPEEKITFQETTGSAIPVTTVTNKNLDSTLIHTTLYFAEDEDILHKSGSTPFIVTGTKENRIYTKPKVTNTPAWFVTDSATTKINGDIAPEEITLVTNTKQMTKLPNRINSKLPSSYSNNETNAFSLNSSDPLIEDSLVNTFLPPEGRDIDSSDFTNVGAIHLGAPLSVGSTEIRRDSVNLRNKLTESGGVIFMDPKYTDINPNLSTEFPTKSTEASSVEKMSSVESHMTPIERSDTSFVNYDRKKGPRIQDIYNQTNPGQDYKIIPFVAEDAIRGKFGKVNNTIHELSNTTQSVPDMVSDFCFIKGRIFMNGEMIPKIDPCELCRCFYGQELCQIQRCPTPPPNCVAEKLPAFCCPRFTCAGNGIIGSPPVQKITMHSKQSPLIIQPIIDREPVEKSKITNQKPEEAKFGIRVRQRPTQMPKPIQTKSTIESTRTTGYSLSTTTTKKAEPTRLQEIQTTPIQTTTTSQIPKIVRNPTTKTFQYSKLTTTKQPETSQTTKESSTSGFFDPWGLLKVSGCNIYGKFFNINDQVEFLSGPCSHCICTVNGVECNDIC